jgi:hypothetical protein
VIKQPQTCSVLRDNSHQLSVSGPVTVRSLSRFFEYSLAISAWKQAGEVRWALRTNPSSGNLHPTEGYLLIDGVAHLSPFPGVYHYASNEHGLELRAELPQASFDSLMRELPPNAFLVAFTPSIGGRRGSTASGPFATVSMTPDMRSAALALQRRRWAGACCCWTACRMTPLLPCWG